MQCYTGGWVRVEGFCKLPTLNQGVALGIGYQCGSCEMRILGGGKWNVGKG